jgi:hypothetical protein
VEEDEIADEKLPPTEDVNAPSFAGFQELPEYQAGLL